MAVATLHNAASHQTFPSGAARKLQPGQLRSGLTLRLQASSSGSSGSSSSSSKGSSSSSGMGESTGKPSGTSKASLSAVPGSPADVTPSGKRVGGRSGTGSYQEAGRSMRGRPPAGRATGRGLQRGRSPRGMPQRAIIEEEDDEDEQLEEAEEEEEEGEEQEGDRISGEEAERLIFGNTDFTKGPSLKVDKQALMQQSRQALEGLGLPAEAVQVLMALQQKGKAPSDPEALAEKAEAAVKAAGGAEKLQPGWEALSSTLGLPQEAWQPNIEDCACAALSSPRVLSMPASAVLQRAGELEAMVKVSPRRARELCCRSPALLLVPRDALEAKLKAMSQATALSLESCAGMVTVHMFR